MINCYALSKLNKYPLVIFLALHFQRQREGPYWHHYLHKIYSYYTISLYN